MSERTVADLIDYLGRFDPGLRVHIASSKVFDTTDWGRTIYEAINRFDGSHYLSIADWPPGEGANEAAAP